MRDTLESEEFYNLMQAYRNAAIKDQAAVTKAYEAVKELILAERVMKCEVCGGTWQLMSPYHEKHDCRPSVKEFILEDPVAPGIADLVTRTKVPCNRSENDDDDDPMNPYYLYAP